MELAIYQGDWYVSFPPFPSVVMLPLTYLFGENTPNNLLIILYAMGTAALAYLCLCRRGVKPPAAAFLGLFYVLGSNMCWMSTSGGVWFQAQALNMLLLTGCLLAALDGYRVAAYALVALAVGCRPFSICAFLPLFVYFYQADRKAGLSPWGCLKKQLPCLILPACIGGGYMWYNYARFGNPLEFGHNYLPEFLEAPDGQFHLSYLLENLRNILLRPVTITAGGRLEFPYFNGSCSMWPIPCTYCCSYRCSGMGGPSTWMGCGGRCYWPWRRSCCCSASTKPLAAGNSAPAIRWICCPWSWHICSCKRTGPFPSTKKPSACSPSPSTYTAPWP